MNNMEYKTISLADQVFERLEADILMGKYQRGEIITELALSSELGVSRTPVREAMKRLIQEHLIEESGKGTVVLGLTRKDFEDMCAIRLRIESLAVRGFIERMNEDSLRELKEAIDLQEFYLLKNDKDHLKTMDGRFHETIYNRCGSMMLRDTLAPLHRKLQKFRRLSIEHEGRAEKSVREHREMYEAMAAGDADLAEKLMNEHIYNAMSIIIDKES